MDDPYEVRIRVNCEVAKFIQSFAALISKLTRILYHKTLIYWNSASFNNRVSGLQNSIFPSVPVNNYQLFDPAGKKNNTK